MSREELQQNVNYYQGLINDCSSEIRSVEKKIEELKGLIGKLDTLKTDFTDKQSKRKSGISKVNGRINNIRAIIVYYINMSALLTGLKYISACAEIDGAKWRCNNGKKKLERQLETLKENLASYQSGLDHWSYELSVYQEPEEVVVVDVKRFKSHIF